MTYYSKKALVSIVTSLIIFFVLYPGTSTKFSSMMWGAFFIKLLLANVFIKIVTTLVFNSVNRLITKESEPTFSDERDRLIELRAVRLLCCVFAASFFFGMLVLALGKPIDWLFQLLAFGFLFSGLSLDGTYLYYYEREA